MKRTKLKIKLEKPPIWDSVCTAFEINPKNVCFTYGDTIYNPNNFKMSPELIEHEKLHMEQQNHNEVDAALWWGKYLRDPKFRLDQEARAYGKQLKYVKKIIKDRNALAVYNRKLAVSLSGPLYGNVIDLAEAMLLIKHYSQ